MAWYGDNVWTRRQAMCWFDDTGGAAGEIEFTIPKEWDDFWDRIDASGNEIRVVSDDSRTVPQYQWTSFTKASRTGVLQVINHTWGTLTGTYLLWLYYGSTSNQGSGAAGVAGAVDFFGHIELGRPSRLLFPVVPSLLGQQQPRYTFQKDPNAAVFVWIDYGPILVPGHSLDRSSFYEEPGFLTASVLNTSAVAQAGMVDAAQNRIAAFGRHMFAKILVQAGTTATNYTVVSDLRTALPGFQAANDTHQRLIYPVGMQVRQVYHNT